MFGWRKCRSTRSSWAADSRACRSEAASAESGAFTATAAPWYQARTTTPKPPRPRTLPSLRCGCRCCTGISQCSWRPRSAMRCRPSALLTHPEATGLLDSVLKMCSVLDDMRVVVDLAADCTSASPAVLPPSPPPRGPPPPPPPDLALWSSCSAWARNVLSWAMLTNAARCCTSMPRRPMLANAVSIVISMTFSTVSFSGWGLPNAKTKAR
mmetsp:Transcript_23858/g.65953  ORF Transcript_23858/g.65953 Transcript_23858/m.65953 type:complete len:211 (-) Transcript_23858:34-666(-)